MNIRGILLTTVVLLSGTCFDASAQPAGGKFTPYNRFPRMVHNYFVEIVRNIEQNSTQRRAALTSPEDVQAYIKDVRKKIQQCFGAWPDRTPLNARTINSIDRGAYRIENIIFESRPGFLVTANLYVPQNKTGPFPGVVVPCGHSSIGKAGKAEQIYAQTLARLGYVVLVYDPIGQGERRDIEFDKVTSRKRISPTTEHLYIGNQQFLVGEFFGSWRAWDGIRAIDYLVSRKDVDPQSLGVTGSSGGGTMTAWLCGLDRRLTMAAPNCFITTFLHNLENEVHADTEQCPPKALKFGLDHMDFLAAMAPKPVIILPQAQDFFDLRGARESYDQLHDLYATLGSSQNVKMHVGQGTHGYYRHHREAMYEWFNSITGASTVNTEPEPRIEETETLHCTPAGRVREIGSRTVQDFTREKSQQLARQRPASFNLEQMQHHLIDVLKLADWSEQKHTAKPPHYRIIWPGYTPIGRLRRSYPAPFTTYAVETEPGIHAIVNRRTEQWTTSPPPRGPKKAILYIAHRSGDREIAEEPLVRELMRKYSTAALYVIDVRGIGESQPNSINPAMFANIYGSDYLFAAHAIMLDRPYLGMRTFDVLRVLDWLRDLGHMDIHIVGKGWGALPATFAAILSDRVTQVTLKNALTSYADIAKSEFYDWPLSCLLPGVLQYFDFPDCYELLRNKGLIQIDPWGPMADPAVLEISL